MSNSDVAISRKQDIFFVEETTAGVLEFPGATDYVLGAGYATINQQPEFTDSDEVRDTRDITDRFQDRFPAGKWMIPTYARPSGTAGTAPMARNLFKGLLGVETVTGGTSVVYSQADEKPSYSIWIKKDHTVFFGRGCTVAKLTAELTPKGAFKCDFEGEFMEMGWVGTDVLNGGEPSAETDILVTNVKRFKTGGYVEFVESGTTYNNSGSGYEITAVNYTTSIVTVGTGLETDLDDGTTIKPFLPTGTVSGAPVESRKGLAKLDSVDTPVLSMKYTIGDTVEYLADEITTTEYPETYVESTRDITLELSVYMREADAKYFYDGQSNIQKSVTMVVGNAAGSIVEIATPYTELNIPEIEEKEPTIAYNMEGRALGTGSEDSLTITFK